MQDVYVSNEGDDEKDGSSKEDAVRSLKRLNKVCAGSSQVHLVEGMDTFYRLKSEIED